MKRTKIIATIGPASAKKTIMKKLLREGADVFRLNFSHGTHAEHAATISLIREVETETGHFIAILQDLQGPKIRVGNMPKEGVLLKARSIVRFVTSEITGTADTIPTVYKNLPHDVKPGNTILLADGSFELRVTDVDSDSVECKVIRGGVLTSHKGINLPGVSYSAPALTEKDIEDLRFGLAAGVDHVAISFVRDADDIMEVKNIMAECNRTVPVIAKIERPEALKCLAAIIDTAEGIMVARGDLGVELPAQEVPEIQKDIIRRANLAGKQVITATQMLESMVDSPRPTRAEVSDVANAVYDGSGGVMLSEETAAGRFPVDAVRMMAKVVERAEREVIRIHQDTPPTHIRHKNDISNATAYAAVRAAQELDARAIITLTMTGGSALLVSKFRPSCCIIAATMDVAIARRASMYWGVKPLIFDKITSTESLVADVDANLLSSGLLHKGDIIVITSGVPVGKSGTSNLMKIHRMGECD